ncbi:integral membrane protein [Zalerion maritima]|uniref:Integral membrane protein n=1 Tax=Zalerion maritima TaxID=339359 RepID=A0AAD5WVA4_9PEZI|nr:integral membrane protein [Zalerion maritima]
MTASTNGSAALGVAVEPAFIVLGFTVGTILNRRRPIWELDSWLHRDPEQSPRGLSPKRPLKGAFVYLFTQPFTTYPFLLEILYWNLTYWIYQGFRAFSARTIAGNEAVFNLARDHALNILKFEQTLGFAMEQPLQHYILENMPGLMDILARIYYSHISLGVCFIIYTYTCLPPPTFRRIRRTIAVDNAIAFVILTAWRCMPPRMLPEEYGFIDVLHGGSHGGSVWNNNKFQLTIAAMPSLHFGTALFFAWSICKFSPHRWLRIIAPLWPAAMLLTIIATANHFVLDAMVGACVPLLGWKFNRVVLVLMPIQDAIFGLFTRKKEKDLETGSDEDADETRRLIR